MDPIARYLVNVNIVRTVQVTLDGATVDRAGAALDVKFELATLLADKLKPDKNSKTLSTLSRTSP